MSYDLPPERSEGWVHYRVAQGILDRDGAILLCANRWYSDRSPVWTLPGGRAENGEGLEEALVREFAEETGLQISVAGLAYVVEARNTTARRLFLTCVFRVEYLGGQLTCEGDSAVEELRYVLREELGPYLTSPTLGAPLQSFLADERGAASYWFYPEY
jgi:8-oxo-dGTP diphosphatase